MTSSCKTRIFLFLLMLFSAMGSQAQSRQPRIDSLNDLEKCATQYSYDTGLCLEPLEVFAKKNPDRLFEIGKRARFHFKHWAALRFFEPAMANATQAQCDDDDLRLAVISGFSLPSDHPSVVSAKKILAGKCNKVIQSVVEKELAASRSGSYIAVNACSGLPNRGAKFEACEGTKPQSSAPVEVLAKPITIDASKANIGIAKIYTGPEGERVTIADIKDKPGQFLIRVDQVRSPINGKTLVHQEDVIDRRIEYWTQIDGKRWNTVVARGEGIKTYYLSVPDGRNPTPLNYNDSETKNFKRDSLQ